MQDLLHDAYRLSHHSAKDAAEIIFAGPPSYEPPEHPGEDARPVDIAAWEAKLEQWRIDDAAWPQSRRLEYAEAVVTWFERRAPSAPLVEVAWHQDENSPHGHLLFSPVCSDGRFSWSRLQAEMHSGPGAKCPRGAAEMKASGELLQDLFHAEVGSVFGLGRGGGGPVRSHQALKPKKRQADADARAKRQLDAEVQARQKAEAERDAALHRAGIAEAERNWLLSGMRWVYTQLPPKAADWVQRQCKDRLQVDLRPIAPMAPPAMSKAKAAESIRETFLQQAEGDEAASGAGGPTSGG